MLPVEVIRTADAVAAKYGMPSENLLAVIDVESGGKVFTTVNGQRMPMILFEPHVFYRLLSGVERDEAVRQKLASPKQNTSLYGKTQAARYDQLARASDINQTAAEEATSWGVGQVLGVNWKDLGYATLDEFVTAMRSGAEGQIDGMVRFIQFHHLDDELINGQFAAFARGYNGPAYRKNKYDDKMTAAATLYGGGKADSDGMLRMGSKGAKVRELQALLVRAGIQVKIDGDFGPTTRDAVKAFQKRSMIEVDGVVGPETQRAFSALRQGAEDKPGKQEVTDIPEVKQGAGGLLGGLSIEGAKQAIDTATDQLQQATALGQPIQWLLTGLSVAGAVIAIAGVAWMVRGWLQSRKTVEA